MNLRIDNDQLARTEAVRLSNSATRGVAAGPGQARDGVSLSGLTSKVAEHIATQNDETERRVTELASLYAKGSYQPDARQLSKALIAQSIAEVAE